MGFTLADFCDGSRFGWGGPWNTAHFGGVGRPLSQLPISLLCVSHPVPVRGTG
ncbi:unnamed protein product [Staurois parvus]|uniref:Uncharacterized protein n=1 Tax=Staurois parvus TaxID=386267 RepID=A0ABN9GFI6_9NEOB|nr:unnamed protein product [Staurois parvus]